MTLTPDRQGYLGNLRSKSLPQLKELLERQEKLLSDKGLIRSLADKGKKIEIFAVKLKEMIRLKTPYSNIEEDKQNEIISLSPLSQDKGNSRKIVGDQNEDKTVQALLARKEENHTLIQHTEDGRSEHSKDPMNDDLGELSSNLQELKLGTKSKPAPVHLNSYERVIKKATGDTDEITTSKFMPSRSLRFPIEESPSLHHQKNEKSCKHWEESAVNPPNYNHQSTKLISIEESVSLIQEQKKRNETLIAERAAQRLAQQFGPKMDVYLPANPDMEYRDASAHHGEVIYDSDDFPSDTEND